MPAPLPVAVEVTWKILLAKAPPTPSPGRARAGARAGRSAFGATAAASHAAPATAPSYGRFRPSIAFGHAPSPRQSLHLRRGLARTPPVATPKLSLSACVKSCLQRAPPVFSSSTSSLTQILHRAIHLGSSGEVRPMNTESMARPFSAMRVSGRPASISSSRSGRRGSRPCGCGRVEASPQGPGELRIAVRQARSLRAAMVTSTRPMAAGSCRGRPDASTPCRKPVGSFRIGRQVLRAPWRSGCGGIFPPPDDQVDLGRETGAAVSRGDLGQLATSGVEVAA